MTDERKRSAPSVRVEVEDDDPVTNAIPGEEDEDESVRSSLWAPGSTLREVLALADEEKVSLELSAGPWVVLRRLAGKSKRDPVFFISAGWFESMQVGDVLSLLQTLRKDGELVCAFDDCTKTLSIERGEIVSASSTLPDDRLGNRLLATGKIDRATLADADRAVAEGKRFGRFLLEAGTFTQHELYEGVQDQLESIVLSLFAYPKGSFVFASKPLPSSISRVKLPKQLMFYILEGSRQSDELREALEAVSGRMTCFELTKKTWTAEGSESAGVERDVLAQIDGTSRTWQVLARSGWSETNTLMAMARLLRAGFIAKVRENPAALAPSTASVTQPLFTPLDLSKQLETVERFNLFLRDMRWALVEEKCDVRAIDGFFKDMTPDLRAVFEGVELAGDGSLDAKKISSNLAVLRLPPKEARTQLRAALEELTQFVLWTAEDQLPAEAAAKLKETAKELLRSG